METISLRGPLKLPLGLQETRPCVNNTPEMMTKSQKTLIPGLNSSKLEEDPSQTLRHVIRAVFMN